MKIYISGALKSFCSRNAEIDIQGITLREILKSLVDEYPESAKVVFDGEGKLRTFIRVYADEDDKTDETRWDDDLSSYSKVLLLPLIAGGAPAKSVISDERRKDQVLDNEEIERFSNHLLLREIGVKGQKKIKAARIVVVGAGALGSPVIQYLAAAGVGTLKIVDFDEVQLKNLQCQVIHGLRDVKRPKVASARDSIRSVNRKLNVVAENVKLDAENVGSVVEGYDLVVDCSDNYKARYLINDACALRRIPLVFGAIYQYEGIVTTLNCDGGPCLRCLFPNPPEPGLVPTCAEGGSISPLGGIVGAIQANEALKLILGIGEALVGKILRIDALNLKFNLFNAAKNENCPICGFAPSIQEVEDFDYEEFCGLKQEEEEEPVERITPEDLAARIENGDPLTIVDVREPHERAILRFPGAIAIPIGQLARRQNELSHDRDVVFVCQHGQRSVFAIRTLREVGYQGPAYSLLGGIEAMKDLVFTSEGGML